MWIYGVCLPMEDNVTSTIYSDDANVTNCGVAECAISFFEEVSFSFNHEFDNVQGCQLYDSQVNMENISIFKFFIVSINHNNCIEHFFNDRVKTTLSFWQVIHILISNQKFLYV
jgi:hypothetical protein